MSNAKYLAPSWDAIYYLMIDLARKVKGSGFKPEVILGVSRGGWPPARVMSDLLGNPNLANIRVEFYKDVGVRSKAPRITQPVTSNVQGKKVLVVDDVADTGLSLKAVKDHLGKKHAGEVRLCTIFYKPQSVLIPDYYARRTTTWIIFPWERLETIRLLSRRIRKTMGRGAIREITRELRGSGLNSRLINQLFEVGDP